MKPCPIIKFGRNSMQFLFFFLVGLLFICHTIRHTVSLRLMTVMYDIMLSFCGDIPIFRSGSASLWTALVWTR